MTLDTNTLKPGIVVAVEEAHRQGQRAGYLRGLRWARDIVATRARGRTSIIVAIESVEAIDDEITRVEREGQP